MNECSNPLLTGVIIFQIHSRNESTQKYLGIIKLLKISGNELLEVGRGWEEFCAITYFDGANSKHGTRQILLEGQMVMPEG